MKSGSKNGRTSGILNDKNIWFLIKQVNSLLRKIPTVKWMIAIQLNEGSKMNVILRIFIQWRTECFISRKLQETKLEWML